MFRAHVMREYSMALASGPAGPVLAGPVFTRFLLGTGRMPHPVGGAMPLWA